MNPIDPFQQHSRPTAGMGAVGSADLRYENATMAGECGVRVAGPFGCLALHGVGRGFRAFGNERLSMLVRLVLAAAVAASLPLLAACNPKVRAEGVLPHEALPTPPSEPRAARAGTPAQTPAEAPPVSQGLSVPRS